MTLKEIHESFKDSFFSQVHKWGYSLTEEDAIMVGLLMPVAPPKEEPKVTKATKKTTKASKGT